MGASGGGGPGGLGLKAAFSAPVEAGGGTVSVLVITYRPEPGVLDRCIRSVAQSSPRPQQLVVVDNGAPGAVGDLVAQSASEAVGNGMEVIYLPQDRNLGYAEATNRGLQVCRGDLVLLLNPDAALAPGALEALLRAASRRPDVTGFAPKVRLVDPPHVIDSVGMALGCGGEGVQRGLGQADLGQYDLEEPVAGVCFAASLIRREAFGPSRVGLLDSHHFMYYEDVDWSLRAAICGEQFLSVPSAVVQHVHSASTRSLGGGFKLRLIQRNLIWTAVKNLEPEAAAKVLLKRSAANLRRAATGRHPVASLRAVQEAWVGLPAMLGRRRAVQRRRVRRDRAVLGLDGEQNFFDTHSYRPEASAAALLSALTRLYALGPSPKLEALMLRLDSAQRTGLARNHRLVAEIVRDSGLDLGPGGEWLLHELESGT